MTRLEEWQRRHSGPNHPWRYTSTKRKRSSTNGASTTTAAADWKPLVPHKRVQVIKAPPPSVSSDASRRRRRRSLQVDPRRWLDDDRNHDAILHDEEEEEVDTENDRQSLLTDGQRKRIHRHTVERRRWRMRSSSSSTHWNRAPMPEDLYFQGRRPGRRSIRSKEDKNAMDHSTTTTSTTKTTTTIPKLILDEETTEGMRLVVVNQLLDSTPHNGKSGCTVLEIVQALQASPWVCDLYSTSSLQQQEEEDNDVWEEENGTTKKKLSWRFLIAYNTNSVSSGSGGKRISRATTRNHYHHQNQNSTAVTARKYQFLHVLETLLEHAASSATVIRTWQEAQQSTVLSQYFDFWDGTTTTTTTTTSQTNAAWLQDFSRDGRRALYTQRSLLHKLGLLAQAKLWPRLVVQSEPPPTFQPRRAAQPRPQSTIMRHDDNDDDWDETGQVPVSLLAKANNNKKKKKKNRDTATTTTMTRDQTKETKMDDKTMEDEDDTNTMNALLDQLQQLDTTTTTADDDTPPTDRIWHKLDRADQAFVLRYLQEQHVLVQQRHETMGVTQVAQELEQEETRKQLELEERAAQEKARQLLRPLTPEETQRVHAILYGRTGQATDIIAQVESDSVQRESFQRLAPGQWLNDEVLHFFLTVLSRRDQALCEAAAADGEKRRRCHFFKSFFFSKLLQVGHATKEGQYDYKQVKRWSKKVPGKDIFGLDKVLFPINQGGVHWVCAVAYMQDRRIQFYDSLGSAGMDYVEFIFQYLQDEHLDKKKSPLPNLEDWKLVPCQVESTPRQLNGYDCGVFTCMFLDFCSTNNPLLFDQSHVTQCRERIALSILNGTAIS